MRLGIWMASANRPCNENLEHRANHTTGPPMPDTINPFPNDPDRREIWTMLVERDIAAFVAADWSMVADDFIEASFLGIDGRASDNPDSRRVGFPTLSAYRDEWLRQAAESAKVKYADDRSAGIHRATSLL